MVTASKILVLLCEGKKAKEALQSDPRCGVFKRSDETSLIIKNMSLFKTLNDDT